MKTFLSPNIGTKGRILRGVMALALFVAAALTFATSKWLSLALFALAVFVAFEALRGWCALRACGIKTKL